MPRMLAFIAALFMTVIAVSSACVAGEVSPLQFTIQPAGNADRVQVRFTGYGRPGSHSEWSSSFKLADLSGLDVAALRGSQMRPLRFAVVREAGRLDCAGNGAGSMANGSCTFTADPAFNDFLSANGVKRPTIDQSLTMMAVGVRRDLVGTIANARYPAPSIDDLVTLAAVGVTRDYIARLAAQGYRPGTLDDLVQFKALGITPEYIGGFARLGYGKIDADDLVQLKALDITPDYVAAFDRLGYGRLPADTLVQLKALDITPEFVRAVQTGGALPSPDRLVMLRALGKDARNR